MSGSGHKAYYRAGLRNSRISRYPRNAIDSFLRQQHNQSVHRCCSLPSHPQLILLQGIQWSTPLSDLIRDYFVLENEYATAHITIEDALSHRSGLPAHDSSYGGFHDGKKATVKDTVRDLRYLSMTTEPRTRFQYCNLMFVTASHVVESLTAVWLGDFLRERIWEPLDMKSTVCQNESSPSRHSC